MFTIQDDASTASNSDIGHIEDPYTCVDVNNHETSVSTATQIINCDLECGTSTTTHSETSTLLHNINDVDIQNEFIPRKIWPLLKTIFNGMTIRHS